jgi:hypothetical protein
LHDSAPKDLPRTRRVWARYPSTRPLPRRLSVGTSSSSVDAWVTDLSAGGMGLTVGEALPAGTLLLIELETQPQATPLQLWASVVRCRPQTDGEFHVGCEFLSPLRETDLQALLQ